MRTALLYLTLCFSLILSIQVDFEDKIYTNHEEIIEKVNSMKTTWKAGKNERFQGLSEEKIKNLAGNEFDFESILKTGAVKQIIPRNDLPENFDWREQMPECKSLFDIRDQGSCSSCWAFAAAEVMSDRICIKSKGKQQPIISTTHIIGCW